MKELFENKLIFKAAKSMLIWMSKEESVKQDEDEKLAVSFINGISNYDPYKFIFETNFLMENLEELEIQDTRTKI